MTIVEAVRWVAERLTLHGIADAYLEGEVLVRHILGVDRAQLYKRWREEFPRHKEEPLEALVLRRIRGEPLAYLVGRREFYGLDFYVDSRVLIPRPETEALVEATFDLAYSRALFKGGPLLVADVGTGSGNIAVSLACHLYQAIIYATDVSKDALVVARINARGHGVENRIHFIQGDLLGSVPQPVDLIVANLPYIKKADLPTLSREIRDFEPLVALDGGEDGLGPIRRLLLQAQGKLKGGGVLLLELGEGQDQEVVRLASTLFPEGEVTTLPDLRGVERVLKVCSVVPSLSLAGSSIWLQEYLNIPTRPPRNVPGASPPETPGGGGAFAGRTAFRGRVGGKNNVAVDS